MLFSILSDYFQKIEQTDSRLKMTEQLAELFNQIEPEEIDKACYLSLGILAPKFVGLELQLAEKMMLRAIAQVMHMSLTDVLPVYKELGDIGQVIETLGSQKPGIIVDKGLSIAQVYAELVTIAKESGQGSQERKLAGIVRLLKSVNLVSAKYLMRIPVQKLRLGFSDMTILDALSWMATGDKSLRPALEHAYNVRADIGQVARLFKSEGEQSIKTVTPLVGTPIRPARATPLLNPEEILDKMNGKVAVEPKFDGFRVQIHLDKTRLVSQEGVETLSLFAEESKAETFVEIFSRNLDNISFMFPELVEAARNLPVESVILDGEAIAVDPQTGDLLDFQETVKRKRKHDIGDTAKKIPLKAFIFDILYLNGESLLSLPLEARRQKLERVILSPMNAPQPLVLADHKVVDTVEAFTEFFDDVAGKGLEGLMAKKVDAPYRAGARDFTWVKYKVGMQSSLADTVDAVVMGYFKGQGKWTEFGLGKILVGVPANGHILSLSKVGSGFSEEKIKEMVSRCHVYEVRQQPEEYKVDKNLLPDVWVEPKILVEIRADSISRSPIYTTGLSLRFPRFIRFRDDKDVAEATTLDQVKGFAQKGETFS